MLAFQASFFKESAVATKEAAKHETLFTSLYLPAAQSTQLEFGAAINRYRPAVQVVQADARIDEYMPVGQAEHELEVLYFPAVQSVHVAPVAEIEPTGQFEAQAEAPVAE